MANASGAASSASLPLVATLFWFGSYRPSTGTAALYALRTFWNRGQGHTIVDVGPFVAGVAAWMGSRDGRRGLADPTNSNGNFDQAGSGIFYPWLPDLPIARIMLLAGIAVTALGLTGLPGRAGGQRLRRAAAVLTLAGVALAGTPPGWPAPPGCQRMAWSSPPCTTPRTTRRSPTLPHAAALPGSRCA